MKHIKDILKNIYNFIDNYIIYYIYDKPIDFYRTFRCWYYCEACNPYYWKLIWYTTFHNRPWDSYYIWELLEMYIKKSNYYFTHNKLLISDSRKKNILKWQTLAINLLHIINNEHELWDWDFNKKGYDAYKCLVYVNTKNVKRFAQRGYDYENNKSIKCYEYMIKEPHYLYIIKAKKLLLHILDTYSDEWYD